MPSRTLTRATTFKQVISSGNIFNGIEPTGALAFDGAFAKWEDGSVGGLFDFFGHDDFSLMCPYIIIPRVALKMAAQTSWVIYVVDQDGDEHNWYDGTTDGYAFITDVLYLVHGEKIKIVTEGAFSADSEALITVIPQKG